MTTTAEATAPPTPDFPYCAYGVDVAWLGEDGGMVARGHVPDLRVIAACNRVCRRELGIANLLDDPQATLEDALGMVTRVWAVAIDPVPFGTEWAISFPRDVTEQTPGAFPVTVLLP